MAAPQRALAPQALGMPAAMVELALRVALLVRFIGGLPNHAGFLNGIGMIGVPPARKIGIVQG